MLQDNMISHSLYHRTSDHVTDFMLQNCYIKKHFDKYKRYQQIIYNLVNSIQHINISNVFAFGLSREIVIMAISLKWCATIVDNVRMNFDKNSSSIE
jgi:hypothetical protein